MGAAPLRRGVVVAAVCIGVAACSVPSATVGRPAGAPPRAGDVVVSGRVETAAGGPLAGRPVIVSRRASVGDLVSDLFLTAFSAGFLTLTCVSSSEPALESCRTSGYTTTTDTHGRYAERLRRTDVRSVTGGVRTMVMATGARPAPGEVTGPAVAVEFSPRSARVTLPDVRLWRPDVRTTGDATTFRVGYGAPPGGTASVAVSLTSSSRGIDVTDARPGRPEEIDARLLEDAVVQASVVAQGQVDGHSVTWRAPVITARGTAGPPPSRGAGCTGTPGSSGSSSASATPTACWLTDGLFATSSAARHPVPSVVVDLGRDAPVGLVVVRATARGAASAPGVRLDASADGVVWQDIGTVDATALIGGRAVAPVVAPDGTSARFVRVTPLDRGGDLRLLTELSVWPPPQQRSHASLGARSGSSTGDRRVAVTLAVVALVAAAGLWGAASRRRGA